MPSSIILLIEAISVYTVVIALHFARHKITLAPMYAVLGWITATMWWVSTAGVAVVQIGMTFIVGGVVFYNSLMICVFLIYLFDGPRAARIAIIVIVVASVVTPVSIWLFNRQMTATAEGLAGLVPVFGVRATISSVTSTLTSLFLAFVVWELLHKYLPNRLLLFKLLITFYMTFAFDGTLYALLAFSGNPALPQIIVGNLSSRLVLAVVVAPIVGIYLQMEQKKTGVNIPSYSILAIFGSEGRLLRKLSEATDKIDELVQLRNELRELITHIEDVREEQNAHIARELHDELGQYAVALSMDCNVLDRELSVIPWNDSGVVRKTVAAMKSIISQMAASTKDLVLGLRAFDPRNGSLVDHIEELVSSADQYTNFTVSFIRDEHPVELDIAAARMLYRVVQEGLNNAMKHSEGSTISVTIHTVPASHIVEIHDDGVGFDVSKTAPARSFGLIGMRERSLVIGGELRIWSDLEKGTTVQLTVPRAS